MNARAMRPGVAALGSQAFDVVVVGAGIHGAAAAWMTSRLGLRTALLDMGDFGAATSASSLKVLHGGLRYLQHANFARMRESIEARRRFLQLAPHLCQPQAFLMPTRGRGVRGRAALALALTVNDWIARDRNEGVRAERALPRGRLLTLAQARACLGGVADQQYTGAAVWYDGLAQNTERLTLSFVLSAEQAGACVANYVKAVGLRVEQGAVSGVEAVDAVTSQSVLVRGRSVINASGPWMEQAWRGGVPGRENFPLVGAWNVVVRKRWFGEYGVALEGTKAHHDAEALVQRGARNLFFVPWREGTMIGTVYEAYRGDPAAYRPTRAAVENFLAEINAVYPPARLTLDDVSLLHVGVQPGPPESRGATASVEPDKHSEVLDHARQGGPRGLFSIKGVKYTTGLEVGERAGRLAALQLGAPSTGKAPVLYGGAAWPSAADVVQAAARHGFALSPAVAERCAAHYGSEVEHVLQEARADGAALVPGDAGVLRAEVRHAVRREHALHVTDVVLRRTDMGTLARPPDEAVRAIAEEMAGLLGWTAEQVADEVARVRSAYPDFSASA
jgi:glycerol-3-phosphate dehydrogenase